jgi:predicted enzyme related to lactoylglutathione lyase
LALARLVSRLALQASNFGQTPARLGDTSIQNAVRASILTEGGEKDMPTIVHFEIPADDVERAKKFYADLFGWKIEKAPEMDYWMITTRGEKQVDGGMMKRQEPQQPITNYIDVASIDESAAKVQQLGGKVVVPKAAVPTFGWFAMCLDTENNVFALWQSDKNAK